MSPFTAYMIGFALLVTGLAAAAFLLGIPLAWIIVAFIIILAAGFLFATNPKSSRSRPNEAESHTDSDEDPPLVPPAS